MNSKIAMLIAAILWISALGLGAASIAVPNLRMIFAMAAVGDAISATVFTFIAVRLWVNSR